MHKRTKISVAVAAVLVIGTVSALVFREQHSTAMVAIANSSPQPASAWSIAGPNAGNGGSSIFDSAKLPEKHPELVQNQYAGEHFGKVLEVLEQAARGGDKNAAFKAHQLAVYCRNIEFVVQSNRATSLTENPHGYRGDTESCNDMTPAQIAGRFEYLQMAVDAHVPGSAVAFAQDGVPGDPGAVQSRANDPDVIAWKAAAVDHLSEAANAGDRQAITLLAFAYSEGTLADIDYAQALKFQTAQAAYYQFSHHGGIDVYTTQQALNSASKLPAAAADDAKAQGMALFNSSKKG